MDGVKEYIFPVYDVDADEFKEYIGFIRTKPELIRCKDCIHHHGYICDRLYGLQDAFTLQDNDYCSRAETKETEE